LYITSMQQIIRLKEVTRSTVLLGFWFFAQRNKRQQMSSSFIYEHLPWAWLPCRELFQKGDFKVIGSGHTG